jgi:hypothetical protein
MALQSPLVNEGFTTMVEEILYKIMIGMVKAKPNEHIIAGFQVKTRAMAETQLRQTARAAAEYYVSKANPSLAALSKEEVRALQNEAIAHALNMKP